MQRTYWFFFSGVSGKKQKIHPKVSVFGIMMAQEMIIRFLLDQSSFLFTLSVAFPWGFVLVFFIAEISLSSVSCSGVL